MINDTTYFVGVKEQEHEHTRHITTKQPNGHSKPL